VLEVSKPGLLTLFEPATFGLAIVDSTGLPRVRWGLAERLGVFQSRESLTVSPVGGLVEAALEGGSHSAFVEGNRYYAGAYMIGEDAEVMVLVADATEEAVAREVSRGHQVSTVALKRLGKALGPKQSIRSLAIAALHAIYSSYELAAAFLWIRNGDVMVLESQIGTTRGMNELNRIGEGSACIAQLAATSLQVMRLDDVSTAPLTANVEAKVCPPNSGAAIVLPLVSAKELIGVLELVARKGDMGFAECDDMFETIAEHLALAIHNAMMFEENERLAMFDPLTGIANHRTMQEFLAQRISEAERNKETVGVVMIDVDHFRSFNELEGHDAGDQVLKLVADALRLHIRNYDLAARYGGEEFTLVLANTDAKVLVEVAERVRTAIEALAYESRSGERRPITASFGCAVYPEVARDAAGLLKAADRALYEAKRAGRNRTVLARLGDAA
jgi:diguanylate cyclase (GGDEF)-like protein